MSKKIVLCVGDSLGLPRPELPFKDTWFFSLMQMFSNYHFVNSFKRAITSKNILKKDFLENYHPNIIILQIGIVDCAPRYHKENAIWPKLVARLPKPISNLIWKYFKKYNKRNPENAFVSPNMFYSNLKTYFERCIAIGVEKVIVVKIQNPGSLMTSKNPSIVNSIDIYNNKLIDLEKEFEFITVVHPLHEGVDEDYIQDGYHLSAIGAKKVFESVSKYF